VLREYEIVAATVSQRTVGQGVEGGDLYSVRYRFLAVMARFTSQVRFNREKASRGRQYGSRPLQPHDPTRNAALATFLFYRFTITRALNDTRALAA